jgi:proteic killer suppression protein
MNLTFSEKTLKKVVNNDRDLFRKFGPQRGKLIKQRLDAMAAAENLEELRHVPGNFHELTETRKGQWACSLDQPYRLIFEPHEDPIPTDDDGKYIWLEIKGVDVTEIVNYHKEK